MAYRWKVPELNAGLVDPQGVMQTKGEQGMLGFVPNSTGYATAYNVDPGLMASQQMQGYNPNNVNARPPVVADGNGAGYRFDSTGIDSYMAEQQRAQQRAQQAEQNRQQIQAKINELQTELDQITNKIAEIDKATPGLAKNPKEWEIAAKRAEIGDMSAYDNLVSRGNSDSSAASGIENELLNAEKLTWGLKSDDTETRRAARKQGEIAIIRAEEWAAKTGKDLPSSYFRLKNALAAPDEGPNANTIVGMLWSKMQDKSLNDADRAYAKALHDADPNSADAPKLREIYENTKGKTEEDRKKLTARKKAAKQKIQELQKLPAAEQEAAFQALSEQLRKDILAQARWDTTGRGLVWRNN